MNSRNINDSKLLKLLGTLSEAEHKRFDKFVNSPIYNQNKQVSQLYRLLRSKRNKAKRALSEKEVLCHLFPDFPSSQPFSKKGKKRLKDTMSHLTKVVEQFFIFEKLNSHPIRKNKLLIDALSERKLEAFVPTALRHSQQLLLGSEHRDSNFYFDLFELGERKFHHAIRTNNRSTQADAQEVIDLFVNYAAGHLLRYYCAALNREKYLNVSYNYPLLQAILEELEKQGHFEQNPLVAVYFHILKLFKQENQQSFLALKKLLLAKGDAFPPGELRQIFAFLINFCTNQLKEGKEQYAIELFRLYTNALEIGILNHGSHLSAHFYLLIVKAGLRIGQLDWVKQFIDLYKHEIPPENRDSIQAFALVYWHFYRKEYEFASTYLLQIGQPEDFYYNFYYRILMICIHYDMDDHSQKNHEHLNSLIEALRQYIRRRRKDEAKTMSAYVLEAYDNFQKLVKRLLELRTDHHYKRNAAYLLRRLEKDIQNTAPLEERAWLLEKVQSLDVFDMDNSIKNSYSHRIPNS